MNVVAMADNCIDVYFDKGRFYPTGNSVDFAINFRQMGGTVTEMTVLGNDIFAEAVSSRLEEEGVSLHVISRVDKPTAVAKMAMANGDRQHLEFRGNALEEISLSAEDIDYLKKFDIVYAERWANIGKILPSAKQPGQIWIFDFSKRLEEDSNNAILPYIDYAFFSYERDDEYIRDFLIGCTEKGAHCAIAMLGKNGSLAYDGKNFYGESSDNVKVVNTVGAGDSYIAGFTYGITKGDSVQDCMRRGKAQATKVVQLFDPYE
jgi:fructoselysine 6-kinase